jgi:hypothetical protein
MPHPSDSYARAHQAQQDRPHRSIPRPHLGNLNIWGDDGAGAIAAAEDSGASDAEQEAIMNDLMEGYEGDDIQE